MLSTNIRQKSKSTLKVLALVLNRLIQIARDNEGVLTLDQLLAMSDSIKAEQDGNARR